MADFAREGLLDGLDGAARRARARLLAELHDDGVGLDELRSAVADDTLFLLPAERRIGGQSRYTPAELAEMSGLDESFLAELRRAQGLPAADDGARMLADSDLDAARTARAFADAGLRRADMLEVARILGRALSQAAEAMRRMTLGLVLETDARADEYELAMRYADAAARLEPLTAPMLGQMLNAHLRDAVRAELVAEREAGVLAGAREVAVGFADLVGFTRMGEEVAPELLGEIAERLERSASLIVAPPVRLVKTLGDAVMLVSPEADPLVEAALALVEAADAEGERFPQLRAGIAAGPALQRAGDWYGRPVNLAARVTALARPGTVLCTAALRAAAGGAWRWSFAGERRVRGVRDPVALHRVRRAA